MFQLPLIMMKITDLNIVYQIILLLLQVNFFLKKAWCASNKLVPEFILFNFNELCYVDRLVTQGRHSYPQWIKKFKLVGEDENNEEIYLGEFNGNNDQDSHKETKINMKLKSLKLLILEFHNHPSLRWEIYGYQIYQ